MEELTGVTKREMLGRDGHACAIPFYGRPKKVLIDLLDRDQAFIRRKSLKVETQGETLSAVAQIPRFRGQEERIFRSTAAPLYDMHGERVGGIQTVREITELVQAQREKGILHAQKQQSRMMESLMVQLGHDLKTPLTPLFALLPIVRDRVHDPELKRMLEICDKSAQQIQGLTRKALDLVRLSSETSPTALMRLSLSEVAESSLDDMATHFDRRNLVCRNAIDPGLQVLGAPEQLALLFENLLSNASRYARTEVSLKAAPTGRGVLVSVCDDGIGLEARETARIFDAFFKADPARHDLSTQGLGLAICKRVAYNHGGEIWAESPGKGKGTTVSFTLSLAQ
jgi:signal transduction histidine kinase